MSCYFLHSRFSIRKPLIFKLFSPYRYLPFFLVIFKVFSFVFSFQWFDYDVMKSFLYNTYYLFHISYHLTTYYLALLCSCFLNRNFVFLVIFQIFENKEQNFVFLFSFFSHLFLLVGG